MNASVSPSPQASKPVRRPHPNAALVGQDDARARLQTPCLALDLDALDANIARMAERARQWGVALRPHAKTHKCGAIAQRQRAAGAVGLCAATLGEAEMLVDAGIDDVLLTSPAIGYGKIARALALKAACPGLKMVVDSPVSLQALTDAAADAGVCIDVFVALDIGSHRIGARTVADAMVLARAAHDARSVRLAGVHAYAGSIQHIEEHQARVDAALGARARLVEFLNALRAEGLPTGIVSGAGTGSFAIDGPAGVYTELQVGSYVFMDVEYGVVDLGEAPFAHSLTVLTRVVSANHPDFVTTDGGTKRFSMGGAAPRVVAGAPPGAGYAFQGDEHGKVILPPGAGTRPAIGQMLTVVPPHCDPTVDMYDVFHVMRGDRLEALWPIEARGAI